MSYNLSQIMKSAHRNYKKGGKTFSECLKSAWSFAKLQESFSPEAVKSRTDKFLPEKDLGGMQSAKVYRKQDRPCLREFYATDSRLPAGPTRGRDYPKRYETEETTERGREK